MRANVVSGRGTRNRVPAQKRRGCREEARRLLVGGVNSPVRAFRHVGGEPLMLVRGTGAEVIDHEGRTYGDFIMGWGALILGHRHPTVAGALGGALEHGTILGLTHPAELELARLIVEAVPSVARVRFTVSGTEACMTAVRLARAQTARTKVVVFEGGYHGHSDSLLAKVSAGIPSLLEEETVRVPFNNPRAFEDAIRRSSKELACVIVEPVAANMGVVSPLTGYLEQIRALTKRHGIVLIFDEVVTGFRLAYGGAQAQCGIRADLTTFGKIIGGGLPIGALGGSAHLMRRLAPEGDVYHGGTFAGHPLSMAAGVATLGVLKEQPPYSQIEALAARLAEGIQREAERAGVPIQVNRAGSMMTVFFSKQPVVNVDGAKGSRRDRFARWATTLRERGVLVPPSPFEALFVSAAHTRAHIDRLVEASREAFQAMRGR